MAINEAEELKKQGNSAFSSGDHETAIKLFSQAIELDPSNHVLYSNRSASLCALKDYEKALEDAEKTIELKPEWAKGYSRKGAALVGLKQGEKAKKVYEEGLAHDPSNAALKQALGSLEEASMGGGMAGGGMPNFMNPFSKPETFAKLASDPRTKDFLSQPDFMQKLAEVSKNPQDLMKHLGDERIMTAFSVAMGLPSDLGAQAKSTAEESSSSPSFSESKEQQETASFDSNSASNAAASNAAPEPDVSDSDKEKDLGNAAYKKRDFETALKHYQAALDLDGNNIPVMNNMAAVYFEQGDFEQCINRCKEAYDQGKSIMAPFNVLGKTLNRMGTAYMKLEKYEDAITFLQKSLTEHRTADTLAKLKEAEKILEEKKKRDYIDPAIAEQERNAGNELFKEGKFADAVKKYSEAILRDPSDPRAYSNRAACYTKLAAVHEAMKDCETCLSIDPSFIKAYIRKAALYMLKKEHYKAVETLELAQSKDVEGKHQKEIQSELYRAQTSMYAGHSNAQSGASDEEKLQNAMKDPEVAGIMSDPAMRIILEQMQSDPKAVKEHLANPQVAAKLQKLINAGIIKIGRS